MAGDWIKMRLDLAEDPAVILISEKLNLGEDLVVGKLHRLWSWADKHVTILQRNGNASVTLSWIDRYLGVPGFAQAMEDAHWLAHEENGVCFPNFARHNGKSAKTRALTSKRVVTHRLRSQRYKSVTREEKRREHLLRRCYPLSPPRRPMRNPSRFPRRSTRKSSWPLGRCGSNTAGSPKRN